MVKKNEFWWKVAAAGAVALAVCTSSAPAFVQRPGELVVAPTRVMLDGKTRSAELVLLNRGRSMAIYRLSLIDMRMEPDGRLTRLEPSSDEVHSAKGFLRFAPRQVTLVPGQSQRIRIAVSRPPNLAHGEYRSHLLLEAVPTNETPAPEPGANIALRFNVVGAVSLPVIVRHGQLSAKVALTSPSVEGNHLRVKIERRGSRSTRGDLRAYFIPQGSTRRQQIGLIKDFAVYTPNDYRIAKIPLSALPSQLGRGKVHISFEEPSSVAGRAKASIELNAE